MIRRPPRSTLFPYTIAFQWVKISWGKFLLSTKWACGAAGSALPWHGRGRRFDPDQVHQFFRLLQVHQFFRLLQVHQFFRLLADTSFELGAAWCQNALTEPGRLYPPDSLLLRLRGRLFSSSPLGAGSQ